MKTITKIVLIIGVSSLATLKLMSAPEITVQVGAPLPPPPPPVIVQPPAPPVAPVVQVPDGYVWDGYEYVGVVGTQYYYLGPNSVWLILDAPRLARFHDWERVHTDWRSHTIHNELYRHDRDHDHDHDRH